MEKVAAFGVSLLRIVLGYITACFACALAMFVLSLIMGLGDPPVEGMSRADEFVNQTVWIPLAALFAAVLAAPVAILAIIVSEIAKVTNKWFFIVTGALASVPALFRGDAITWSRAIDDLFILAPLGAIAGFAFWLVRHRKWPV